MGSVSGLSRLVRISDGVAGALSRGHACVALESTIVTHGLPYPTNLHTALACEHAVRAAGAVPATVALLDGIAHIGLNQSQLERLALPASNPIKTSRRDLATVLAMGTGAVGGTTVSGTIVLAHHARIPIFATGGIGGVHRGAQTTMDISADLTELSRTPTAIFCSGAKSILDLGLTLEYLETAGVTVASFHPDGHFPAFYSPSSGLTVGRVKDVQHAAAIIDASHALGLTNGLVFGVPIPDAHAPASAEIQRAVEQALRESVEQGIDRRGKEVTPWLLKRVSQLTDKARESNVALVVNNARVAAETAVHYAELQRERASSSSSDARPSSVAAAPLASADRTTHIAHREPSPAIVVIGCAAVDITAQTAATETETVTDSANTTASAQLQATTYPGTVSLSPGGVARNMAEAAARILAASITSTQEEDDVDSSSASSSSGPFTTFSPLVRLVAPIANDEFGKYLVDDARRGGVDTAGFFLVQDVEGEGEEAGGGDAGMGNGGGGGTGTFAGAQHRHRARLASRSGILAPRTPVCSLMLDEGGDLLQGVADFELTRLASRSSAAAPRGWSASGSVATGSASATASPSETESTHARFVKHVHAHLDAVLFPSSPSSRTKQHYPVIAIDANLGPDVIAAVLARNRQVLTTTKSNSSGAKMGRRRASHPRCIPTLLYEPTSLPKCDAVLHALARLPPSLGTMESKDGEGVAATAPLVDVCTPNELELRHLHRTALTLGLIGPRPVPELDLKSEGTSLNGDAATVDDVVRAAEDLLPLFGVIVLKRGREGVTVVRRRSAPSTRTSSATREEHHQSSASHLVPALTVTTTTKAAGKANDCTVEITHHPIPNPLAPTALVNTTGAGDTLAGALLAACSLFGPPHLWPAARLTSVVRSAQEAARRTLGSRSAVAPEMEGLDWREDDGP